MVRNRKLIFVVIMSSVGVFKMIAYQSYRCGGWGGNRGSGLAGSLGLLCDLLGAGDLLGRSGLFGGSSRLLGGGSLLHRRGLLGNSFSFRGHLF
jgi:hypothetical protein